MSTEQHIVVQMAETWAFVNHAYVLIISNSNVTTVRAYFVRCRKTD